MLTRTPYRWQMYTRPEMSAEERALQRESIRNFLGGRSPNPVVARYYRERSRQALLASENVSEARKQELRSAGPLCTPEDEAAVMARRAGPATPSGTRLFRLHIACPTGSVRFAIGKQLWRIRFAMVVQNPTDWKEGSCESENSKPS